MRWFNLNHLGFYLTPVVHSENIIITYSDNEVGPGVLESSVQNKHATCQNSDKKDRIEAK